MYERDLFAKSVTDLFVLGQFLRSKEEGYATGVSLEDYLKFFHLLSNIQDVDTALTFYHIAGAAIDPSKLEAVL